MNATKMRSHLPATIETEHRQLIATERLYNQVLVYMRSVGAGFTRDMVESVGHRVVRALKDALWYIDTAHQQFQDRGIRLPEAFKGFQGYNDYKKNRKSKPRMRIERLMQHSQELAGLLMLPSLSASVCFKLRADIEALSNALRAYSTYLKQHSEQQQHVHSSTEPMRDPAVDSVACVVSAGFTLSSPYVSLQSHMDTVSLYYEPVCVNEFAPIDRFERRSFINNLSLSVDVYMYRMAYGGSIGTLTYIWKIDPSLSDHEERNAHALLLVTENLPKYVTRDMKRTFIDKYTDVSNCSAMVLRHIYRELTEDSSAASSLMQAVLDNRVAKFLLSADDTDLILDLRTLNGKPGSTKFDALWTGGSVRSFLMNMLLQLVNDVMEQTTCTCLLPSQLKIYDNK